MADVTPAPLRSDDPWPATTALRRFAKRHPHDALRGAHVYAILAGAEVVYVGATGNLGNRLLAHGRRYAAEASLVIAWPVPEGRAHAEALEAELIRLARPRDNVAPGTGRFPR